MAPVVLELIFLTSALPAQEWHIHTVTGGENLTVIARRYNVTVDQLQTWNNLTSDRIFIGQELRIQQQDGEWYVVQKGDNLSVIARKFDTTVSDLQQLNQLRGSRIYPGQRLHIAPSPKDEAVYVVRRGDTLSEISQSLKIPMSQLKRINALDDDRIYVGQQLRLLEADMSSHIVERGDALWEIAKTYGMKVSELKDINNLTSDRIYPGQVLKLTAPTAATPGKPPAPPPLAAYVVKRGDNLIEIARLHQMSLRELRDLNNLHGSLIHPGQRLKVRPLLGTHSGDGGYIGRP